MRLAVIILAVVLISAVLVGCGGPATRTVAQLPAPITTPSGLTYQDFKFGNGTVPQRGDVLTISYQTYLEDGTLAEKSDSFTFIAGLGKVIPGWDEGVSTMRVGGERKLTLPPDLAYGAAGRNPGIPPNATIITYIDLLDVATRQTTEQGVQYVDIVEGDGFNPIAGDTIVINYTGWLASDGTKFDSSLDPGRDPFSFKFASGEVIRGFDEGMASMRAGGTRVLIIPPELAYGDQGSGSVPPGATLIFEIEFLDLQPGP